MALCGQHLRSPLSSSRFRQSRWATQTPRTHRSTAGPAAAPPPPGTSSAPPAAHAQQEHVWITQQMKISNQGQTGCHVGTNNGGKAGVVYHDCQMLAVMPRRKGDCTRLRENAAWAAIPRGTTATALGHCCSCRASTAEGGRNNNARQLTAQPASLSKRGMVVEKRTRQEAVVRPSCCQ